MALLIYIAWFLAGVFLANAIPHVVQGICGNRFQTRSLRRAASANPLPWST